MKRVLSILAACVLLSCGKAVVPEPVLYRVEVCLDYPQESGESFYHITSWYIENISEGGDTFTIEYQLLRRIHITFRSRKGIQNITDNKKDRDQTPVL